MKKALISGITGQDGSYLAEFLLQKGYEVHGILRRSSSFNTGRIEHLYFDEWVRDHGPLTMVLRRKQNTWMVPYRILDFKFNGWGEKFSIRRRNLVQLRTSC